ncbi:MAG: YebC/PmpR family DNA-binding transcriptional regulator [Chloroflexi bacterium]|nr:YebC/PmpR family DNA-binding transcriptional regulator [Chloroflexota bacterium]
MSGHSKWASIKRAKGVTDAKRGQVFTKLGRELAVATREGGPNPDSNPRLRLAIERARASNMAIDTIDRAIKRAAGGAEGAALEQVTYEGYGPGGAALLVEVLTDNRNRTVAEIRNAFNRGGGSLGETGCVAWQFEQRGLVTIDAGDAEPEEIELLAIDAGADDVRVDEGAVEVYTVPTELDSVRSALVSGGANVTSAEMEMVPTMTITLGPHEAASTLRLMERIEDLDDVQKVYSNLEISEEVLAEYAGQ